MRVFGILVILLLLAGGALFFFLKGGETDKPATASKQSSPSSDPVPKAATSSVGSDKAEATDKFDKTRSAASSSDEISSGTVADTTTPSATKPVIVMKDPSSKKSDAGIAAMQAPNFDVVRVDRNCGLLVAGTAEPTARVHIYSDDEKLGTVQASRRGEWVFVSAKPLGPGARQINAKATNPNGQERETPRLVIMQVPDCSKEQDERAPAIALLAPKADEKKAFEKRVSKLLQVPEPEGDVKAAKNLSVGAIDYDEQGNVALSGKGLPGRDVRVYLENKSVGTARIDKDGNWELQPSQEISPGQYTLRADQLDKTGNVLSRIEIPFQRAPADDVILAKGGLEIRAVVQPGNSLWRIARRMYGEGTHYTTIYQANQDQIKDPDLIFPGQIFKLPSEAAN